MRDKLADILASQGPTNERQLFIQKSFLSDKKFVGVPYENMPKLFKQYLDKFAVKVLDQNGGKVIVSGSTFVGKSFFIQQLAFNAEIFRERAKLSKLEFANVPIEHVALVLQNAIGRWVDYVELVMKTKDAQLHELIFVTESIEAAVGISVLGGNVVLEASNETMHAIHHQEMTGMVKQWNSWEHLDIDEVFLDKASMVDILSQAHLDVINSDYPEINVTRKHVALLVDHCVRHGDLKISNDMSEDYSGRLYVQPGIMARVLFRFASTLAFNESMRNAKGEILYAKAIRETFSDFESTFEELLNDFLEFADDDEGPSDDVLRQIIENSMPGVQVMHLTSTKRGKAEATSTEEADKEASFSDFSTLKARLEKSVLGQTNAISSVVNGLKISAAGLNLETKPLRSLLFLGPTGVGKTELSLSIARELMDTELPVKRVDMSEFGAAHEAAKLLGSPPGYVGHEAGGVLTNFVKEHPRSVVILDEIEKAHPKVWDSFLQILDAGRLTDNHGETVDFTKTIVIMTSNLGADRIKRASTGFATVSHEDAYKIRVANAEMIVKKAVEEEFRPELVNRIDQIVVFNELPTDVLRQVISKEINHASEKLTARGFTLTKPKNDILDHIAGLSDVSKYGAREVQRVVGTNVLELLADQILTNSDKKTLTLSINDKGLTVKAKASKTDGSTTV